MPIPSGARRPGRRPRLGLPDEPPRRALPALLVPIGLLIVASNLASLFYATLVERHPLWLLGLSSINRYLALVTPHTALWSYLLVGGARLLVADPFFYLLGYWYGERAIHALERRLPSVGNYYRQFERLFARARYPAVFVAPNNAVCLFAGSSRMNPVGFAVANVAGTLGRLMLIRAVGNVFGSPIRGVTGFLDRWKWPLLALSAVVLAVGFVADRRQGRTALGGLAKVGDDLSEPTPRGGPDPTGVPGPTGGSIPRGGTGPAPGRHRPGEDRSTTAPSRSSEGLRPPAPPEGERSRPAASEE